MIHTVLAIFVMGALIVLFVGILMVFKHHPAPPQVPYDGSEGPLWDHDALERKDLLFHKMENAFDEALDEIVGDDLRITKDAVDAAFARAIFGERTLIDELYGTGQ